MLVCCYQGALPQARLAVSAKTGHGVALPWPSDDDDGACSLSLGFGAAGGIRSFFSSRAPPRCVHALTYALATHLTITTFLSFPPAPVAQTFFVHDEIQVSPAPLRLRGPVPLFSFPRICLLLLLSLHAPERQHARKLRPPLLAADWACWPWTGGRCKAKAKRGRRSPSPTTFPPAPRPSPPQPPTDLPPPTQTNHRRNSASTPSSPWWTPSTSSSTSTTTSRRGWRTRPWSR